MQFNLHINLDNDDFTGDPAQLAVILRSLAEKVEDMGNMSNFELAIMDSNGNRVGRAEVVED
jgi:hypothetical protein